MACTVRSLKTSFSRNGLRTAVLKTGVILGLLCTFSVMAWAIDDNDPHRYRSGVRNGYGKYQLKGKRLAALTKSLKEKTGFLELQFDAEGFLRLGDRTLIKGGSVAARDLVMAAVDSAKALVLEDHSYSRDVSFAKLSAPVIFQSRLTMAQMENRAIHIDFSDFTSLQGERDVLAAFDIGFVVLHEMAHGALNLRDASSAAEEPGECENYINRIRRELNLPERLVYHARPRLGSSGLEMTDRRVELSFARSVNKNGKSTTEESYLRWNLAVVGGRNIPEAELAIPKERVKAITLVE